jgi:hypothetical protein
MSEISALSHQYESLKMATDNLNGAIVLFKKKRLMGRMPQSPKYARLVVLADDLQDARAYLLDFLKNIQSALKGEDVAEDFIPHSLWGEYKEGLKRADPYFERHIENVIHVLEKGEQLEDANFRLLDNLLSALDIERTVVFRKLRIGRHG